MMTAVSSAAEVAAIEAVDEVIDGESTAIVSVAAVAAAARRRSPLNISEEKLEEIIIAMAHARYLTVQFDGVVTDPRKAK
ncbi:hypothetical protein QEZ47_00065 [Aminobacter anthyllidis]|uniref:hypothetical protein n=1 Tax=Aminobacter anthyllidis TaxID=1035067 RepID=UPI0024571B4C|nr:hypothetical protein [Aminobacter anthyllidis]MDH4983975.1 hypothetical protein [Aminobacter anthyllidis]